MRRIMIEHARKRPQLKRGGGYAPPDMAPFIIPGFRPPKGVAPNRIQVGGGDERCRSPTYAQDADGRGHSSRIVLHFESCWPRVLARRAPGQ